MSVCKLFGVVSLCVGVIACGEDGTSRGSEVSNAGDAGAASCEDLTYELFGQSFLESYCVTCHGAALAENRIRLDSLANVVKNGKKAKAEVSSKSMPPRGAKAPTSEERALFAHWISCGPT